MALRFHESLGRLVATVVQAGVPLDDGTVFLRDGAGRLTLARRDVADAAGVTGAVRQALGAYASVRPVVTGRLAEALVKDPAAIDVSLEIEGCGYRVRYVDRRFVGADWLREPSPADPDWQAPRLVFSSLKGGVGRSTALAVVAADLARQGLQVLAIDLDLEAPGIGFMLLEESDDPSRDQRPKYGVLDYLVENGLGGIADEDLEDFIGVKPFADGSVHVIPVVGRVTDEHPETMLAKLSRALVEDQGVDGPVSLAQQVRAMVDRFAQWKSYDAILIDARAGLAESSAPALLALGGHLLFFGIDQPQTFRGYRYLFAHLLYCFGTGSADSGDWRERLSFVQAKAPSSGEQRGTFREQLHELCAEFLYDQEKLRDDDTVELADFNFAINDRGWNVPHDATHIEYHPGYAAFDPIGDRTRLDPDVYRGPFGGFLERIGDVLAALRKDER